MSRRGFGMSGGGRPLSPFNPAHRLLFRIVVRHLGVSEDSDPTQLGKQNEWGGRHLQEGVSSGHGCASGAQTWRVRLSGDMASAHNVSAHLLRLLPFLEAGVWVFLLVLFCFLH